MLSITTAQGESVDGMLQIPHVVFDEISFKRLGFKKNELETAPDAKLGFQSSVNKIDDGKYAVSLKVQVIKPDEYKVRVQITGFCEVNETNPHKEILLKENAVAILFPYIRAELTLITAQPETDTLVLPAININMMLKKTEE